MKAFFKTLFTVWLVLASAGALHAQNNYYTAQVVVNSTAAGTNTLGNTNTGLFPNSIACASTATNVTKIDMRGVRDLSLTFKGAANAATTTNIVLVFTQGNGDDVGTNVWHTGVTHAPLFTWTIAATGTTQVAANTNLSANTLGAAIAGVQNIYLETISMGAGVATTALTNYSLTAFTK